MAHAIHGYSGACKNIHGHSYELHVSIATGETGNEYLPAPGFIMDFKEIKKCVQSAILDKLDHKIFLSRIYVNRHPGIHNHENLVISHHEPTVENILIHIRDILEHKLPGGIVLAALKLYETKDSYAEWINGKIRVVSRFETPDP